MMDNRGIIQKRPQDKPKNMISKFFTYIKRHWRLYAMLAPGFIILLFLRMYPCMGLPWRLNHTRRHLVF